MGKLTDQQISTIKDAASKLTGAKRREFQAQVGARDSPEDAGDDVTDSRLSPRDRFSLPRLRHRGA